MRKSGKQICLILFLVMLLTIIGASYLILNYLAAIRSDIKNLELTLELSSEARGVKVAPQSSKQAAEVQKLIPPSLTNKEEVAKPKEEIVIPTTIIFETQSSPALLPQTKVTITIESVEKTSEGLVNVNLKVFTKDAASYSALEPRDLFELVSLEAENQKPFQVKGQFNSIPPKSGVSGSVQFRIDSVRNNIILQTGSGDNIKFYEFNFTKETYKEVVIG